MVPLELTRGPFTLAQARRAGLARWHLEGASWRRIGPRMYAWVGLPETPKLKLEAAQLSMPPGAAFSGKTAAWLHGLDVSPCEPIEMILPSAADGLGRDGVLVHRVALDDSEVEFKRGFRTTSLLRTMFDLSWKLSLVEAVVVADLALHAGMVRHAELTEWIECRAGVKGVKSARRVLELADPAAESPMETRLRLLLVLGGLPRPQAQVRVHDDQGRFLGRPDLYYPDHRLGLEYDGGTHRTSLAEDNRRQNRLLAAGVRLLRFTAGDVVNSPDAVVMQVRGMLR
jgi:very-short-patch-repair endonuclease